MLNITKTLRIDQSDKHMCNPCLWINEKVSCSQCEFGERKKRIRLHVF
jgi:hypothetical protein